MRPGIIAALLLLLLPAEPVESLVVSPSRRYQWRHRAAIGGGGTALFAGGVLEPTEPAAKTAIAPPIDVPPLLFGGTGLALGLRMACTLPLLSWGWFASFPLQIASSIALARSTLPFATWGDRIDIAPGLYARLLGLHIVSMSSLPVLGSMLWPLLRGPAQRISFLIGVLLSLAGSLSEIRGHFLDSWVFEDGCEAWEGDSNAAFYAGLAGGFAFQAAALYPGPLSFALAGFSVALLPYRAAVKPWKESKKAYGIPLFAAASVAACAAFVSKLRSAWPLLFFVQSVNIVRNTERLIDTGNQALHHFPAVYGGFSYVFPFALSLHPATRAAGLGTVLAACAASVVATDLVERRIIAGGYP